MSVSGIFDAATGLIASRYLPAPGPVAFTPASGSFSSRVTFGVPQYSPDPFVGAANVPHDTDDVTPIGLTHDEPPFTDIRVTEGGRYKVLSSVQCDKTLPGTGKVDIWVRVKGFDVPNSATRVVVNQNLESLLTVEWFLDLVSGDTVSVACLSDDVEDAQLLAVPEVPDVAPAIPSIITTILRIG